MTKKILAALVLVAMATAILLPNTACRRMAKELEEKGVNGVESIESLGVQL